MVKLTHGYKCWTRMPEGKPWGFAAYECQKIDSHLPVIRNEKDNLILLNVIKSIKLFARATWIGEYVTSPDNTHFVNRQVWSK